MANKANDTNEPRTNYIHQLQDKNEIQAHQLLQAKLEIIELRRYLLLPKFHVDTTVQVGDVQDRLDNIVSALNSSVIE